MLILLLVVCSLLNAVVCRNFLSANSFTTVDELTARASVILFLDGSFMCSGTLISNKIVYTAAHCLWPEETPNGTITVSHSSDPSINYRVKAQYVPENFKEYHRSVEDYEECWSFSCCAKCVQEENLMLQYAYSFDYALLLLEDDIPICTKPAGPVAATLANVPIIREGDSYTPANDRTECFVAGYGATEFDAFGGKINLAIANYFDDFSSERCDIYVIKGVFIRFHNSSEGNGYGTHICPGDSGSGIQCISQGGKQLSVIGVNTQIWQKSFGPDPIEKCQIDHDSFAIATNEHREDLFEQMRLWNEMENYNAVGEKCGKFLKENPYKSVMHEYFHKEPEFN